jgi:MFS superfamily sulfate permease-like transporter
LIAVILAITASRVLDLASHGAATVGTIPRGLPTLGLPAFDRADVTALLGASAAMFVVILAQSAATARAYAAKYAEPLSIPDDLSALSAANAAAAFSGTFVVNGSPTKAQVVDSAGGRSQLAELSAAAVVLVAAALLTGPLAYLPRSALAAVVFLIAIQLVDVKEMRRILALRRNEFAVALLTAAAVVVLGVEDGIVLAVIASVVDHLRHSYNPLNSVLVKSPAGYWQPVPLEPGTRTEDGLVIYRFGTSLYYANAARLLADLRALVDAGGPPRWFVFDCAAVEDIDYTASTVLARAVDLARQRGIRFAVSAVSPPVRRQLDGYGISKSLDPDAYYETARDALDAFHTANARGSA